MRDLPNEQRQAIELAYFYGLTHSQIADFLRAAGHHQDAHPARHAETARSLAGRAGDASK